MVDEASQVRPDSKVILTSAYSDEMVMATMNSPVIRGFIRKPFPVRRPAADLSECAVLVGQIREQPRAVNSVRT